MRVIRTIVAVSGALLCAFLACGAAGQTALSEADLRSQVLGKLLQYSDGAIVRFETNGGYSAVTGSGRTRQGRWAIAGDKICVEYVSPPPDRCFQFFRTGDKLQVDVPWNRSLLDVQSTSGDLATAQASLTLMACERQIPYALTGPSPDVPSTARGFSGVWVGQWESSRCAALIVQQILADGSARILIAHGSHVGSKPGYRGIVGTIRGNTLTASDGGVGWEYVLVSSTVLDAKFRAAGVTPGKLTRQK
jgi:hypothetical protein